MDSNPNCRICKKPISYLAPWKLRKFDFIHSRCLRERLVRQGKCIGCYSTNLVTKALCAKCLWKARLRVRAYRQRHPDRKRESRLLNLYGIRAADREKMLKEQQNKCAICDRTQDCVKRFVVDHDHLTGRVRGLLCDGCNSMLGRFEPRITKVMDYLGYIPTLQACANHGANTVPKTTGRPRTDRGEVG